jgi:hypothetical protein
MNEEFQSVSGATEERRSALRAYFRSIATEDVFCSSFRLCRESHRGEFYENQLPHVGDHYDLIRHGRPFRVLIVGQESGERQSNVSMEDRRLEIIRSGTEHRFFKEASWPGRNSHMHGTTSALRSLFGYDLGADYGREFISIGQKQVHLFECFSFVNYLMCSALDGKSNRGHSTMTMRGRCACHFRAIMQRLSPTVIILQGVGVRRWILKYNALPLSKDPPPDLIDSVQIGDTEAALLSFSHPSHPGKLNWGRNFNTEYLIGTVVPTIRECLSRLGFGKI